MGDEVPQVPYWIALGTLVSNVALVGGFVLHWAFEPFMYAAIVGAVGTSTSELYAGTIWAGKSADWLSLFRSNISRRYTVACVRAVARRS